MKLEGFPVPSGPQERPNLELDGEDGDRTRKNHKYQAGRPHKCKDRPDQHADKHRKIKHQSDFTGGVSIGLNDGLGCYDQKNDGLRACICALLLMPARKNLLQHHHTPNPTQPTIVMRPCVATLLAIPEITAIAWIKF